ncbi:MAG: hypothetical protein WAN36_11315, partial [Calditrichia bacterium]
YLLWMYRRVMFGPLTNDDNRSLTDISGREIATLMAIIVFIFWIGVYPKTFMDKTEATVVQLIEKVDKGKANLQKENRSPLLGGYLPDFRTKAGNSLLSGK